MPQPVRGQNRSLVARKYKSKKGGGEGSAAKVEGNPTLWVMENAGTGEARAPVALKWNRRCSYPLKSVRNGTLLLLTV